MSTKAASPTRSVAEAPTWLVLLSTVLAAFAIWIFRYDYSWGSGDQDEFVPYLLHLLDDSLLSEDWFVGTQTSQIGVRTFFVWLLRIICVALPPHLAVAALFVASWVAIAIGIDRLVRVLGGGSLASAAAIVVALCLTPKWTLGGNDLVYTMLVPEMVAWAWALPALLCFFRRRYAFAGVLLGVASWFQPLVGILVAAMLALSVILEKRNRNGWRHAIVLSSIAAVLALPVLIPIGLQSLGGDAAADTSPSILFILTQFRAPHHYVPSSFSFGSWARVGLLVVVALALAFLRGRRSQTPSQPAPGIILLAIATMCLASWFMTEVIPVDIVVKLQVFKLTVIGKLLLISLIATSAESLLYSRSWVRDYRVQWIVAGASAAVFMASILGSILPNTADVLYARLWSEHSESGLDAWARDSSPLNALFVVPPSNSSLRSHGQRAIVVNYAAVPFAPPDMMEWYARLRTVAPVPQPATSHSLRLQLDSSYYAQTWSHWSQVADTYGVDYLVHRSSTTDDVPFEVSYRDSAWVVYRLIRSSAAADS
ncbi:MAG: hypothetical protein HKN37_09855 [Rhodothermales bacterium]|nr:hypothetical protein [Rhodothermales bacterium]